MANGIGRMGGVVMPWICFYLATINLFSPFLLFSFISVVAACSDFFFPYDTMGKDLDS
jgi:putative MFS transporter